MEPISLPALERNVFELAEKFRKDVMGEMETARGEILVIFCVIMYSVFYDLIVPYDKNNT